MDDILNIKTERGHMAFYLPFWLEECTQAQLKKVLMLIRQSDWIDHEYTFTPVSPYDMLLKSIDRIILEDIAYKRPETKKTRHVKMKNIIKEAAGYV